MKEHATIAKGTFWAFTAQMAVKLFGFVYLVIITRLLSASDVGMFNTAIGILTIIYVFGDLGMRGALNRYVPYLYGKGEMGELHRVVRLTMLFGSALALVLSAVVFLSAGLVAEFYGVPALKQVIEIMAVWVLIQEIFDIARGILNGRKLMLQSQGLEALQNLLKIAIAVPAIMFIGSNVMVLSGSFVLAFTLSSAVAVALAAREVAAWKGADEAKGVPASGELLRELVAFGFTVTLVSFFWMVIQNINSVMIPKLAPGDAMAQNGIYMVTMGLANLLLLFASSILAIFFPVVSEMHGREDKEGMVNVTATSVRWIMLLSLPVLAVMMAYPGELLKMFYGETYEAGWLVLALFSLGLFVRGMSMPVGMVIAAVKKPEVELKIAVFATLLNVALNLALVPLYGMNGAALASALALLAITLLLFSAGKATFGFRLPGQAAKLLLTGAVVIGVMLLLRPAVAPFLAGSMELQMFPEGLQQDMAVKLTKLALFGLLFCLASLVTYVLGVFVFRVIGAEEVQMMDGAMRRAGVPEEWRARLLGMLLPH